MQVVQRSGLIDGCRGLSVLLVIVGHVVGYRISWPPQPPLHELGFSLDLVQGIAIRVLSPIGGLGVQVFFVISGFLITGLLVSEEQKFGEISIGAFYLRRIFRILPAFALFLLTVLALRAAGLILLEDRAFLISAAFLCNVSEFKCSWWLGHTWSLSVEEQFYLIWPLLFVFLRPERGRALLIILFVLTLASFYYPQLTNFGNIAVGALVATSRQTQEALAKFATRWPVAIAFAVLLFLPLLPGTLALPSKLINAVNPFLIAIVFFGSIARSGPLVPLIESRLIQKIGLASYGIYLWQQLGTAPESWNGTITGADIVYGHYGLAASFFIVPAVISYLLVERPLVRLGKRLSDQLIAGRWKARFAVHAGSDDCGQ
jgi:peptidoglycan/LPS O-acetylase OafA/YrhL